MSARVFVVTPEGVVVSRSEELNEVAVMRLSMEEAEAEIEAAKKAAAAKAKAEKEAANA